MDGPAVQPLTLPDGEGVLYRHAFEAAASDALFEALYNETAWQQHVITLYGRAVAAPRLSAWYGDTGAVYTYSGLRLEPLPWTPTLQTIKNRVEALAATRFNSVLLNLYRSGQDSMGWHSDAEAELGRNPVIASVSLGAVRRFLLRHKKQKLNMEIQLEHGSVLILRGATQQHWRHALPKTRKPSGPRINLTFRAIV